MYSSNGSSILPLDRAAISSLLLLLVPQPPGVFAQPRLEEMPHRPQAPVNFILAEARLVLSQEYGQIKLKEVRRI